MSDWFFSTRNISCLKKRFYKDIAFGPKNIGLDDKEIDKRVHEAAEFAGLSADLLDKSPFELSGGQKRRAAIAGVIAMEPKILILDEPAAGLDPRGRNRILNQIREYHAFTGNTVLLVSHSMEDVANFADKILVMNKAKVFAYDTVENVFARSEELRQIGLAVPQVTNVFHRLLNDGFPVPKNVYTVGYAKKKLLRLLQEGRTANDQRYHDWSVFPRTFSCPPDGPTDETDSDNLLYCRTVCCFQSVRIYPGNLLSGMQLPNRTDSGQNDCQKHQTDSADYHLYRYFKPAVYQW